MRYFSAMAERAEEGTPASRDSGGAPHPGRLPLRVMKFGGTSVGSAERMRRVAAIVLEALERHRVIVVPSAVAGTTDLLVSACERALGGEALAPVADFRAVHQAIATDLLPADGTSTEPLAAALDQLAAELDQLAAELERALTGVSLLGDASPRVRARVAALGERASAALLAALFAARGRPAERLDPRRLLPCDGHPLEAEPRAAEIRGRLAPWRDGEAPLALFPGFFGGDAHGEPMLLGRGGSDTSAALIAQAVDAERLDIWTDVAGIFTADPRLVPAARPVAEVSYEEAMELAHFGAKVLHPKSIAPARAASIPVHVLDTLHPERPGTVVRPRRAGDQRTACGLSLLADIALLSIAGPGMKGVPGIAARLFAPLAEQGISVVLITQGSSELVISLGVRAVDAERAVAALGETFSAEIATGRVEEITVAQELAVLSLVGDGMRHHSGVAGRMFGALGEAEVNVVAIAQGGSERSICAVIDAADGPRAARAVHARFFEGGAGAGLALASAADGPPPGRAVAYFAPASIGNVAAGFDVLGAAIEPLDGEPWGDVVEVAPASADELRCLGPFARQLPAGREENLVWRARAAIGRRLGTPLPPLALTLWKGLPVASGLGSSAASAVAAVAALDHFLGGSLGDAGRLEAAAEVESQASGGRHLDNVAPILRGGLCLVAPDERIRLLPWPDELRFVLIQPELALATRESRSALPREVPLALAVAHGQNLAALVHALHAEDLELIAATLRDLLAEPFRAPLVPGFRAAQRAALDAGALACSLSGAGPALFAVARPAAAAAVAAAASAAWAVAGIRCRSRLCRLARTGARALEGAVPWS